MNRLAQETSPYLRQHATNPVDWYAWGEEALARARAAQLPLLVSIGYSACHWCHVMAHESFADPQTAALMNARFVCVKVDREERPDIDAICMAACQTLTGQGGWPLNVFLTPDERPFFAGTYFPPQPRPGMPSWRMVLEAVDEAWRERRAQVSEQGTRLAATIAARAGSFSTPSAGASALTQSTLSESVRSLAQSFDRVYAGWGGGSGGAAGGPKFPPHCTLEFLLAAGDVELAPATLHAMAAGGIYDQLGGGFARYAVDAGWRVPHFEKMLYDNALLARAYLHGWQVTREARFAEVATETLDWALAELRGPEGGFYASLDADSGGVEGSFYVWTLKELRQTLAPELVAPAVAYFGATEQGNFEHGSNVLQARGEPPAQLPEIRAALLAARAGRERPSLDDKRITAWNALMIAALADAGAALEREDYLQAARACTEFVLGELRDGTGGLLRSWKDARASLPAYLEDHAYLLQALLVLYEATFDEHWYVQAVALADAMIERFADPVGGGFFTTARDQPHLVARIKDLEDMPTASGNSAAALGLLRLARLSGEGSYERHAVGVLERHAPLALRQPLAFGQLLEAMDLHLATPREVAIVGAGPLAGALRTRYRPHMVIAGTNTGSTEGSAVALLRGREFVNGRQAAYVCERFACRLPVTELEALEALL
jgi:uncharacterized protein YyaL (SSP411 family)